MGDNVLKLRVGLSGSCSRTRSGLLRLKGFLDSSGVSSSRTRSGLLRIKSFVDSSDGLCSRSQSDHVRCSPPIVEAVTKDDSGMRTLPNGSLSEDMPSRTRSGLVRRSPTVKTVSKDKRAVEGLPDGWRKEYRPRKNGSFLDVYYIDPVSGYEFRSFKDVHRYLETGDIRQCAVRPKKSTICEVHIIESQTHASASPQHTRPGTADKGIQCEILTSDGIMVPLEELIAPYNGNDTEHTVLPEPENLKAIQGSDNKLETSEHVSIQPVSARNGSRQTKSVKRKERNAEVKSKKRKTSSAVTAVRASPRLAALKVQLEVSIKHEDAMVSINHVDQVQTIEESAIDQTHKSQSGSVDEIHGNLESTFSQLQLSQADTANGMQAMQENTTIHSQPSQLDTLNPTHRSQENSGNQLQSVLTDSSIPKRTTQECTIDEPSQPGINHIHTDQEFTGNQFRSNLPDDTVISLRDIEECTAHSKPSNTDSTGQIQANEENTANQVQSSLTDTVIPVPVIQEYATGYSQLSKANTSNKKQANQEYIADQVQSSLTDTVIPVQVIKEYTTGYPHINKADISNQMQANQENTDDHLYLSQVDRVTQMQIIEENLPKQPQLSQSGTGGRIQIDLESTTNHLLPNYDENSMLQCGLSWAPEQNSGALSTDFWKNVETQASSVSMPINGAPVASFPANVRFHNAAAAAEPALPPQVAPAEAGSDQSGLAFQSVFGNIWSDPCIEFAFKTLTGDIPVLDDTTAVTDYFPEQQDLNKGPAPNRAGSVDNSRNHTQVDVNLPPPALDDFYNGNWFPPQ
ncbi:Methyl-CpG-binding domain-containing protein 13 [Zea mays]|uniref:Methyl-CpG-binding domain-containing protein 13 n=1 Tax=Zea mays TaxID=4577 RepID=A0A3L6F2K4_MAIZE|nr:Methyl-CpG-binding domain-containing protein 13 [Zea mays]